MCGRSCVIKFKWIMSCDKFAGHKMCTTSQNSSERDACVTPSSITTARNKPQINYGVEVKDRKYVPEGDIGSVAVTFTSQAVTGNPSISATTGVALEGFLPPLSRGESRAFHCYREELQPRYTFQSRFCWTWPWSVASINSRFCLLGSHYIEIKEG